MKAITENDLDCVKQDKEMQKELDERAIRYCFVCKQKMVHVGGLVWRCENCDMLDIIEHTILPYGRDEYKKNSKIELK